MSTSSKKVLLGFEVPSGKPFYIPTAHIVISGMTQLSGKSTTAEAIVRRSKETKALVFLTKRGEKTFFEGSRIQPYYRERFDWEYVRGLLEASMKERLKFETPWIIRICKQARRELSLKYPEDKKLEHVPIGEGLQMVRRLLARALDREKLREFDRNIYTLLAAYMDKVLPVLAASKTRFVDRLELKPGINVMDLTDWYTHEEVQMLVIRSCMEHILQKENNVTVVLPEAWKMLPQSKNTPVKLYFEKFIREGATNINYLIIDAQDLGGVDKSPLRQVSVWIMGKMMEANEVERLIKQTLGLKVPAREIQTLPLGHFMVAAGDEVKKVYAWPHGIPKDIAVAVAKGALPPERVKEMLMEKRRMVERAEGLLSGDYEGRIMDLQKRTEATNKRVDSLVKNDGYLKNEILELKEGIGFLEKKIENLYARGSAGAPPPGSVELQKTLLEVNVTEHTKTFKLNTENMDGKVMWLAKSGFLNEWHSEPEIRNRIRQEGWAVTANITLYNALQRLVKGGFLGKMKKGTMKYKLSPFVNFVE